MVLIGIGSNRGDSRALVEAAFSALEAYAQTSTLRRSRLWRTSPVDCPPGSADFVNAAAAFEAREGLQPETLLPQLKRIERQFGRNTPAVRNAPRELDLDLLVFDNEVRNSAELTLPHPRAAQRRFVLAPAAEVSPQLIWPGGARTVSQLLEELMSDEQVVPLDG